MPDEERQPITVYNYHPATREYLGEGSARPDPLEEDKFLIPANATTEPPPASQANKKQIWQDGEWSQIDDFRGQSVFNTEDGTESTVMTLGAMPENYTFTGPGDMPYPKWNGTGWASDPVAWMGNLRDQRSALLRACDWTQMPDSPLSVDVKAQWTAYRVALRALPATYPDPAEWVWPVAPV